MLLLKKYGATLNEQIAVLLHDVPHTAFSHVADFVFANEHHEYHELFHEQMIAHSEIPEILKKNKIPATVIIPEHFPLVERDLPDLCADRIDYGLRDTMAWKNDGESVAAKLAGLMVHKKEFMFSSQAAAEAFAQDYLLMDQHSWAHPREAAIYVLLAQAITHALEKKLMTPADLFTDDETVYRHLLTRGDIYIRKKLDYLTPNFRIEPATKQNYDLRVKTKVRIVDPKVLINNHISRLSELSPRYRRAIAEHRKNARDGYYVRIFKT
jgi:HD superfamily phosphohydrolase